MTFSRKAPTALIAFTLSATTACSTNPPRLDGIENTPKTTSHGNTPFDQILSRGSEIITWPLEEPEKPIRCVFEEGGFVDKLNGIFVLTVGTVTTAVVAVGCTAVFGPAAGLCKPITLGAGGIIGFGLTNKLLMSYTCPVGATTPPALGQ